MKYVIICEQEGALIWISAVSDSELEAKEYLSKINPDIRANIVGVDADNYPIFLIEESGKDFEITSDFTTIVEKIKVIEKIEEFDDCYFTYYEIKKPFFNKPYGIDRMGSLDHYHVDNECLDLNLDREGTD